MTTLIESAPASARQCAARTLAYRRLAAAILGLDVKSLSTELEMNRTRRSETRPESRSPLREAALR